MNGFLTMWVAIIGMPHYIQSDFVCVGVLFCFSVRDLSYYIISCSVLYDTQRIILSFCNLLPPSDMMLNYTLQRSVSY